MLHTERQMLKNSLLKDGDYKSTKEVFERIAKMIPDKNILAELDANKNIVYHTAKDLLCDIESIGEGLLDLGLEDKHIAIMAGNCYKYIMVDMAIAGGVGVVTPIDAQASGETLAYLLNTCEADAIVISASLISKLNDIKEDIPNLKTIITIDRKVEGYLFIDEIMEKGRVLREKGRYANKKLDLDKTAMILFTSGTTGANKGVILTQRNMAANIINCLDIMKTKKNAENSSMSVLPMHHATEINTHIMPRIAAGRLTYINESLRDMMANIQIFKPTVITVVPMVANMFYKGIWLNAGKSGKDKLLKKGIKLTKMLLKLKIDIRRKLFKDVYAPFGGNLRQIVCGGGPLNPEVVKGLRDLGIYIQNGFGITECGPLVSMNTDTLKEVYSIGEPAPNLEVKIMNPDENGIGELCVRGASVSKGYYKDDQATAQVHDADGFFHTGDLMYMDKKGRLFIAGRMKNLIVLDNGKNVFPEEIETFFANTKELEYIRDVVVYEGEITVGNENKNAICAGIFVEDEQLRKNTEKIKQDIKEFNKTLPAYKRIAYVNVVDSEFERNSSKKIIRPKAVARHSKDKGIII